MSDGTVRMGAVLSILIVTETEFESPALFVAEQVYAAPTVSMLMFVVVQPLEKRMPDSPSLTDQLT